MSWFPEYFHSYVAMVAAIFVTYIISRWYYKRREGFFDVWDEHKKLRSMLYYQTTGITYRHFKITFEHLLQKQKIYEQDYVVYKNKDYAKLRFILTSNKELCDQMYERHQNLISHKEWMHVQSFFSSMFWFMSHFERQNSHFDSDDINRLQQDILKFEKECVEKFPDFLKSGIISGQSFVKTIRNGAPFK